MIRYKDLSGWLKFIIMCSFINVGSTALIFLFYAIMVVWMLIE